MPPFDSKEPQGQRRLMTPDQGHANRVSTASCSGLGLHRRCRSLLAPWVEERPISGEFYHFLV